MLKMKNLIILIGTLTCLPLPFILAPQLVFSTEGKTGSSSKAELPQANGAGSSVVDRLALDVLSPPVVVEHSVSLEHQAADPVERLEFLHIPKTGGSMLESLGGRAGIRWGACHFKFQCKRTIQPPWKDCPPEKFNFTSTHNTLKGVNLWHLPLQVLSAFITFDPYDDFDVELARQPKTFFTVIRNPYEKLISTYYYGHNGKASKAAHDPQQLNEFISTTVASACKIRDTCFTNPSSATCGSLWFCGTQHDFVYDGAKRMIDHLVHFEAFEAEFSELSKQYALGIELQSHKPNPGKGAEMTAANFTDASLRLINENFRKDFYLGKGYAMILPSQK